MTPGMLLRKPKLKKTLYTGTITAIMGREVINRITYMNCFL